MKKALFNQLLESVQQAGEIVRGEREQSREFFIDAAKVKEVRSMTKLSQAKFAAVLQVDVGKPCGTGSKAAAGRPALQKPCSVPFRPTRPTCCAPCRQRPELKARHQIIARAPNEACAYLTMMLLTANVALRVPQAAQRRATGDRPPRISLRSIRATLAEFSLAVFENFKNE